MFILTVLFNTEPLKSTGGGVTKQKWRDNQWQGDYCLRLTDALGQRRLACLVQSYRRATLAQIAARRTFLLALRERSLNTQCITAI